MAEPKLEQIQIKVGAPGDALLAAVQSTPTNTVQVSAGNATLNDNASVKPFAGGNSGSFAALASGMGFVSRWDLLSLDISGGTPVLAIDQGTSSGVLENFEDSIPALPANKIPLAAILITEVTPSPVVIDDSDIEDIRGFFHQIQQSASSHGDLSGTATTHHDSDQIKNTQTTPGDWAVADGSPVKDHLDELAGRVGFGVFVAKIGGSSPDYAGSAIRTALSDFENSDLEFGLFIVREDMTFSGGNLTVRKPIKMVGQVEPGGSFYAFDFNGSDVLTFAPEATVDPGYIEAEFIGISIRRGVSGTGGIEFLLNSSLRLRFSRINDQVTGTTIDFIRFVDGAGTVDLEASSLIPASNQNLISGLFRIVCRRCNITDTTGKAFGTVALDLYLIESTTFLADDFTDVTTLRVWLDGTSILAGSTQFPAGFTNLDVAGNDFWAPRFAPLGGISFSKALNFNISGNIVLGNSVISLGSSEQTISRSDLVVTGTKAGSEGTRIEGTPASGNFMIKLTGDRVRFQGVVFRSSVSVSSHTGGIIGDLALHEGNELVDCELQAEGSEVTGFGVALGSTSSSASDRNVLKDCWIRSSPGGTPSKFSSAVILRGTALMDNCVVEGFSVSGVGIFSADDPVNTGSRMSKCVVDMSSCISGISVGIHIQGGILSDCRVRCPGLTANLDAAVAIKVANAGGTPGGEGSVVSNCQLSGEGPASTRRIGIGVSITASSDQCKVSGCSIKDFRKQGVKIEGDLNIVVHNIISSINDGTDSPAIEAVAGADNNLVDANLETTTSGYVDGGATNHFDTANTDNTGNKTV